MKKANVILSVFFAFLLFLIPFGYYALSTDYHKNLLNKLGTLNDEDKAAAFNNVELYLEGETELRQDLFTEREILHMADVKLLFDILKYFLIMAAAVFVIMAVFEIKSSDKNGVAWTMLIGSGLSLIISILIILFLGLAFKASFVVFHKIFFSNNLWLLDPSSKLIQVFPEAFFSSIAVTSILTTIALSIVFFIGSGLYLYNRHLQEKRSWGKMWRVY